LSPQRQWNHDLDLLWSRDVIGHVSIRLAVGNFHTGGPLWPSLWRYGASNAGRTHARTLRWFYTLSNTMHCIRQTIIIYNQTTVHYKRLQM